MRRILHRTDITPADSLVAHGTSLLGALGSIRNLEVERSRESKVFAYLTVPEVLSNQYAWFEHVGDGLWVRVMIVLGGEFKSQRNRGQYACITEVVAQAYIVDFCFTHQVWQMALRQLTSSGKMYISEFVV